MLQKSISGMLLAAGLALSTAALAHEAYTTRQVNVRAGPDVAYPVVAILGAGSPVEVTGCVSDYQWCDVIFGDSRGWVFARTLQYVYQSRRVPLYEYGATLGLPIVSFSLFNYWDDHYRSRSFYHDRPRWQHAPHANWNDRGPRDNWRDRGPRDNWRDRGPRDNNWRDRQVQPQYIPQRPEPQYRQQPPQYRQTDQQYRQPDQQYRQPDQQYRQLDRQRGQNQPQVQGQPQVKQPQVQQPQPPVQQPRQPPPNRPGPGVGGYVSPQSIQPDVTGGN